MQLFSPQPWEHFLPKIDYSNKRYALGLFFIFCQCVVWIAAAVITQFVYDENDEASPFLMTYIGMAMMTLFLPIELLNDRRNKRSEEASRATSSVNECDEPFNYMNRSTTFDSFDEDLTSARTPYCLFNVMCDRTIELADPSKQIKPWRHKEHMLAAIQITPAMFFADWAFNNALRHTSVASATVIVSSQNVVVFLLAVLTKIETFSWIKLGGVVVSMAGIALTAVHDTSDDEHAGKALNGNAIWGDFYALAAAISYGLYTVQVRLFCPQNEDLYKMQLLMGYIGLFTLIPCLPYAAYLMYNVRHEFTMSLLGCIVVKGLLDFVLTDYFLFRSVVLTSATVATVGLGLTIPMAFIADVVFCPQYEISIYSVIGALSVGAGFISVSLSINKDGKKVEEEEKEEKIEPSTNFAVLPGWAQP